MTVTVRVEDGMLETGAELATLLASAAGSGAVVTFVGLARAAGMAGTVERLVLERHPTLTDQSLRNIAAEAHGRFQLSAVHITHRCGEVPAGEAIVFAGVAATHRRRAFDALDYVMDRLKTEAVFWKREVGEGGSEWIEPAAADYAARDRWD